MEVSGEQRIAAPRDVVWRALNDPEILQRALPGCEQMTRRTDTVFDIVAMQAIGPIKARFRGTLTLTDITPPESYTIAGEGQGGPAGFAKGEARVRLISEGSETKLLYNVNASVGGKLAQIGQRLIDQTARKLADDFFVAFGAALATTPPPEPTPPVQTPPPGAPPPRESKPDGGLSPLLWVPVFIGLTLVLVAVFAML